MSTAIPAVISDLSTSWLDDALRRTGELDVDVAAIDVEPLDPSAGLIGDLARLHVSYRRGDGPSTMIVKLPTTEPGGHRVGSMLRAWSREVAFYREIVPASPGVKVPRCFHLDSDDGAGRWVVVLEDCPSDPVDAIVGATTEQAAAAVDALADFHATWWESDTTYDWMPGFDTTGVGGLQEPWLDALPLFMERYGHLLPGTTGEWLARFAPTLTAWSHSVARRPLTIVHADYRLDNVLFTADGMVMIDWQTALRGPGAMDLTSFVMTSLTIERRRSAETELIEQYLDRLAAGGIMVDRDDFNHSYDENVLWWMGQFAHNLARLRPDDEAIQRSLDTMIERTFTTADDRDVGRILS